jgi:hypothetical protein
MGIPLLVGLSESLTSQSRHSLTLAGSPPAAKLLIPLSGEMSECPTLHSFYTVFRLTNSRTSQCSSVRFDSRS